MGRRVPEVHMSWVVVHDGSLLLLFRTQDAKCLRKLLDPLRFPNEEKIKTNLDEIL